MKNLFSLAIIALLSAFGGISSASAGEWVVQQDRAVRVFIFEPGADPRFCTVKKDGILYSTPQGAPQVLSYAGKGMPVKGECGPLDRYVVVFPEDLLYFTVPKQ